MWPWAVFLAGFKDLLHVHSYALISVLQGVLAGLGRLSRGLQSAFAGIQVGAFPVCNLPAMCGEVACALGQAARAVLGESRRALCVMLIFSVLFVLFGSQIAHAGRVAVQHDGFRGGDRTFQVAEVAAGGAKKSDDIAVVTFADVVGEAGKAEFTLRLSRGVPVEIYTLANPYRVILDLPDVGFQLPKDAGRKRKGLVTAFRYGLFAEGKGRIVIDVGGPVLISGAQMVNVAQGSGVELIVSLEKTDLGTFGAGTGAARAAHSEDRSAASDEPDVAIARASTRPVIVIDPGHGGIDPGTISPNNVNEKALVLSVALKLERDLKARGRYDVHMTRRTDVFVSLDKRLKFSRERNADLFISLHADAIAESAYTQNVRGATVYTLSERASDEQARLMAEKENNSDLVAGLSSEVKEQAEEVNNILIDLMRRETANFSTDFSNVLVSGLRKSVKLSRAPKRSAAFKVLKQTKTPSVLVELGYLSNLKDEKMMQTADWQFRVSERIGAAVDSYFAQRSARAQ